MSASVPSWAVPGAPWSELCDHYGLTKVEAKIFAKLREGGVYSALSLIRLSSDHHSATAFAGRVHIQHLREKLRPHGVTILNLPGTGYYIEARVFA